MGAKMCCDSTSPTVVNVNALEASTSETNPVSYKDGYQTDAQDIHYGQLEQKQSFGVLDLSSLRGVWIDSYDDKPVGHIVGSMLHWNEKIFVHAPTELLASPNQTMRMMLDGEESLATLEKGPPARLSWSDGAVWVRDELQGSWVLDHDGLPICHITSGQITWDPSFKLAPSTMSPYVVLPFGQVTMKMVRGGEESRGIYDPGPPAMIKWNDGKVWRRRSKP